MKRIYLCIFISFYAFITPLLAQVENTGMTDRPDSAELGKISVSGYVDVYYGFDFNQPKPADRAYFVSSSRHNETNINLAYMDIRYQNDKVRARFVPGIGTYINANYAAETGTLKNLVEAYAGIKLSAKKNIWLDAGVLGSPYTNESAISKDHLLYTRSFAPEFVPYYLSGVRLTLPVSKKVTTYFYLLNGWQQITDVNNEPAACTQVEYKINNNLLLNWNTFIGSEKSALTPQNGMRYFTDIYAIYNPEGKFGFTTCVYLGMQQWRDTTQQKQINQLWGQANFMGRWRFNKKVSLAARVEYFEDMNNVVTKTVTGINGFNSYSSGLCLNIHISKNAVLRVEGRNFYSPRKVYLDERGNFSQSSNMLISNMTVWF